MSLPNKLTWFRLPEYVKQLFQPTVTDNSAPTLLGLDSDGNPVAVEKSSIGGSNPGGPVQLETATLTISPTNINQGDSFTIVPAQGAGILTVPVSCVTSYNATTAFTNTDSEELVFAYDGDLATEVAGLGLAGADWETTGGIGYAKPIENVFSSSNANKPLDVMISNFAAGSLTGSTGTITVTINYAVIDFN